MRDLLRIKTNTPGPCQSLNRLWIVWTQGMELSWKTYFDIPELYDLIDRAIDEDATAAISDGDIIRSGYNATLVHVSRYDETRKKRWIALQQQEREQTGISSLKISLGVWVLYRSDKIKSI